MRSPTRTTGAFVILAAGCGVAAERPQAAEWRASVAATTPATQTTTVFVGRAERAPDGTTFASSSLALLASHARAFGVRASGGDLVVTRERIDALGMAHVRLAQRAGEIPVWKGEILVHFDRDGRAIEVHSAYVDGADGVDVTPRLLPDAARAIVRARVASTPGVELTELRAPELVVFAKEGSPRLAWHTRVRLSGDAIAIRDLMVDAHTGEISNDFDDLQSIEGSGTGALGATRKIQVSAQGAGYAMIDTTRTAGGIRTYDAKNTQSLPGTLTTSTSLTSWDTTATRGRGAAVDAHYSAGVVFDFYKAAFGRNGIDGKGGGMTSTAHFAQSLDNALWDPESKQMMYGDGDQVFRPLAAALDVVAHEFTHGVTQAEAGLVYQDQPGAVNEAISDIFAALIEHAAAPDPVKNFTIGEDVTLAGYIRDMKNPGAKRQPSHMTQFVKTTQDNGGVHINSGIVNNAFYLMTVGGVNPKSQIEVKKGIGWEKSAQVWYRTLAELLLAKSDFAAVAQANVRAAQDLSLTQPEQDAVACAWIATGVLKGTCAEVVEDAPPGSTEEPGADPTEPGASPGRPRPTSTIESSSCGAAPGGPRGGALLAVAGLLIAARCRRRR